MNITLLTPVFSCPWPSSSASRNWEFSRFEIKIFLQWWAPGHPQGEVAPGPHGFLTRKVMPMMVTRMLTVVMMIVDTIYLFYKETGVRWNCIDFWKDCSNSIQLGERERRTKEGKKKKSKLGSIFCSLLSILDFVSSFYHNPLYCFHDESLAYSNGRRNVFIAKVETISRVQTKFGRDSYLSLNIQL